MITIEQEERVRKLLDKRHKAMIRYHCTGGITDKYIALAVGVDDSAVKSIRLTMDAVNLTPPSKVDEIRRMFLSGLTSNAIAVAAKASRSTVLAVRRFYYLQPRRPGGKGAHKCPTCGAMMFSAQDEPKRLDEVKKDPPLVFHANEALALYEIVNDVCELDRLCVVREPAFYYLAKKARETLEALHGKSSSDR